MNDISQYTLDIRIMNTRIRNLNLKEYFDGNQDNSIPGKDWFILCIEPTMFDRHVQARYQIFKKIGFWDFQTKYKHHNTGKVYELLKQNIRKQFIRQYNLLI